MLCLCKVCHGYTWMVPRRNDRRLRHTGSRMSMQLKLRQAAGALAQDRACWTQRWQAKVSKNKV